MKINSKGNKMIFKEDAMYHNPLKISKFNWFEKTVSLVLRITDSYNEVCLLFVCSWWV